MVGGKYFEACLLIHVLGTLLELIAVGIGTYSYWNSPAESKTWHNCSFPLIAHGIAVLCFHVYSTLSSTINKKWLYAFILIALLPYVGILCVKKEILDVVRGTVETPFQRASKGDSNAMEFVNTLQKYGKCCGTDGPSFWMSNFSLPKTCCGDVENSQTCSVTESFSGGCKNIVAQFFDFFIIFIIIWYLLLAVSLLYSDVMQLFTKGRRTVQRLQISYSRCRNPLIV